MRSHPTPFLKRVLPLALSLALVGGAVLGLPGALPAGAAPDTAAANFSKINHVIVIYQENWSFDSLYGYFPGANGLANAANALPQVDKTGQVYATLPQPLIGGKPDLRFPPDLANAPYDAGWYVPPSQTTGDLVHRFYQEQYQIDFGRMDKFVAWSDAAGLVMSYYNATNGAEGKLALQYTLADNFFHAAYGGSFLNHFFLVCACAPRWPDAPASKIIRLDSRGQLLTDGQVTPDGYAVNTSYSVNTPHPANITDPAQLVPEQTMPNIGDRLSDAGVSWAWYSGGWNNAIAGHPDPLFQFHHQAFAFFANYADGTPGRAEHLKDVTDFTAALSGPNLPAVSFVKPLGNYNEHPGYADLVAGQEYVAHLVKAVQDSAYWADTAIIITYDENGGRYDHVAPPRLDRWGDGSRVPAIIISPYAKKGFVDHTRYDTTSILKFIETRWSLPALTLRDRYANNLGNAFDFTQTP